MAKHVQERAHAKINLSLAIHGRRPDGYHQLSSLVAFAADIYDVVTLTAAPAFALDVSGQFRDELVGQSNLIETVSTLAQQHIPDLQTGHFRLEKSIPVASGVGGGSADAAAAMRALIKFNEMVSEPEEFVALAPGVGADVPVCFSGQGRQAAFMQGIGEKIYRPANQPYWPKEQVFAVLVNPGVAVSTGEVFKRLGAQPINDHCDVPPPQPFASRDALIAYLAATGNDMEAAAIDLEPVIGDVLRKLESLPDCLLARMSGSGATCFGLFATADHAESACQQLKRDAAKWWIVATLLV